jgi:hypothetical protein
MKALSPRIQTAYEEIPLRLNKPLSAPELSKMATTASENYQKQWAARMLKKVESGDSLISSYPYPVQVWKLGDQALFILGGETVIEYAITLKRLFGDDIFVFGYSNDVMAYIPSTVILEQGGYEGASSQMVYGLPGTWAPGIETDILNVARKLAAELELPLAANKIN